MSEAALDKLFEEAKAALAVAKDAALDGDKSTAEQVSQRLLAFADATIQLAKHVATPHKIPLFFHGYTLRYPEDCEAAHQLNDEWIARMGEEDERARTERKINTSFGSKFGHHPDYADFLRKQKEHGFEPKFLPDSIWDSSQNCSEQGLGMFEYYDDFPGQRFDYNWEEKKVTEDNPYIRIEPKEEEND